MGIAYSGNRNNNPTTIVLPSGSDPPSSSTFLTAFEPIVDILAYLRGYYYDYVFPADFSSVVGGPPTITCAPSTTGSQFLWIVGQSTTAPGFAGGNVVLKSGTGPVGDGGIQLYCYSNPIAILTVQPSGVFLTEPLNLAALSGNIVGNASISGNVSITGTLGTSSGAAIGGSCTVGTSLVVGTTLNVLGASSYNAMTAASLALTGALTAPILGGYVAVSASGGTYTVGPTDTFLALDLSAGAMTVDLPVASNGRVLEIAVTHQTSNTATLQCAGSDAFNSTGSPTTLVIATARPYVRLVGTAGHGWMYCAGTP